MNLRGVVFTSIGLPVCAGALSAVVVFLGHDVVRGVPIATGDWIGAATFGLGALAVVAVSTRAWLRTRRGGSAGEPHAWLARLVPALIAIGLVAGVFAMRSMLAQRDAGRIEGARALCQAELREVAGAAVDACVPIALDCRAATRDVPSSNAIAAERRCLRERLAAPARP
ncbi:hypothetical protein L6R52_27320 [Myxococcota bacterium]|nr:hypothetical protein [Myxococcota bacterium]